MRDLNVLEGNNERRTNNNKRMKDLNIKQEKERIREK